MAFQVIEHPLLKHKLALLRDKNTSSKTFRALVNEISMLMAFEATRNLPLEDVEIETPLEQTTVQKLAGKKMVLIPIMRAGLGMVDGVLNLVPSARVGHIGIFRNEETLEPQLYFFKTPGDHQNRHFMVLDPMLATGGSAIYALDQIKKAGAESISMLCLVAAPEGVEKIEQAHPDVPVYSASLDRKLNEKGYILPGLGDAGDRIFGTK